MEKTNYDQDALHFLARTGTTFTAEYIEHGLYFDGDEESRDIYRITLTRKGREPFKFRFGQSIANSGTVSQKSVPSRAFLYSGRHTPIKPGDFERRRKVPTAYDVLACLTKQDPSTFTDFCSEYGYDEDSRKAEKIYFSVQKEWEGVRALWSMDEITLLQEIN